MTFIMILTMTNDLLPHNLCLSRHISGLLESESLRLNDVCSVNIYMRDMNEYALLNEVYANTFNFPNPPTRVCVQCPLPDEVGLIFDAVSINLIP